MNEPSTNERVAALIDQGRLDEAKALVDDLLRFRPNDVESMNSLGRILNKQARPYDALDVLSRAAKLAPRDADVMCNLGHAFRMTGQHKAARQAFQRAVSAAPDNPSALANLGATTLAAGRPEDAVAILERAVSARADHFETHYNLGLALHEAGRLAAAADQYRHVLTLRPGDAPTLSNLGAVLAARHELDAARRVFGEALESDARCVPALTGLAGIAELEGRDDEAMTWLERARAVGQSDAGLAIAHARMLMRQKRLDDAHTVLEPFAGKSDPATSQRAIIHYTLGDIDDAARRYTDAFGHYVLANDARPGQWDPAEYGTWVDRVISVFTRRRLEELTPAAVSATRPVFIVGMPRSGTSLVEQILASHSVVHGGGELPHLGRAAALLTTGGTLYPETVAAADRPQLDEVASYYLRELGKVNADSRHVTDKMWQNFTHIGLMQIVFGAGARVIHCTREPMDTLLSCYFQSFGTRGLAFTNRLDWLAAYYRQYRRLMDHWRKVADLDVFDMSYEHLVRDQEGETRRLVDWLDLSWEPACLDFHRTRRTVLTASHAQVREPMHDRSIGRYRNYPAFVDELKPWLHVPSIKGDKS